MTLSEFQPAFVTVEQHDQAIVARMTRSQLSEEDNIDQMAQELLTLIDQFQCQRLVLSMDVVNFITSAALGKLIVIHRKLHRKDGLLIVCDVRDSVAAVLKASKLNEYFTIAPDMSQALLLASAS